MKRLLTTVLLFIASIAIGRPAYSARNIETIPAISNDVQKLKTAIKKIADLVYDPEATEEKIQEAIQAWHINDPHVFNTVFNDPVILPMRDVDLDTQIGKLHNKRYLLTQFIIPKIMQAFTINDCVHIRLYRLRTQLEWGNVSAKKIIRRLEIVINSFKQLGIEKKLSEEQLKILGACDAFDSNFDLSHIDNICYSILFLERLAAVSNIQLPEALKS